MNIAKKRQRNRENPRASTGPKSAAGKARASANSFRHGLAISVRSDPALSAEAEAFARCIAGEAGPHLLMQARPIAEAQVDLIRVRRVQHFLLARLFAELEPTLDIPATEPHSHKTQSEFIPRALSEDKDAGPTIDELFRQIEKLGRYEARARSRRNRAMEIFDAVRTVAAAGADCSDATRLNVAQSVPAG